MITIVIKAIIPAIDLINRFYFYVFRLIITGYKNLFSVIIMNFYGT